MPPAVLPVREGRLLPGAAGLYPGLPVDRWQPADALARAVVRLIVLGQIIGPAPWSRVLPDTHFAFRGGVARRDAMGDATPWQPRLLVHDLLEGLHRDIHWRD